MPNILKGLFVEVRLVPDDDHEFSVQRAITLQMLRDIRDPKGLDAIAREIVSGLVNKVMRAAAESRPEE
jgi:hypothetical protein